MTIGEFVERCTEICTSGSLQYSREEGKAIAKRLLKELYHIPDYRIITEPSSTICRLSHNSQGPVAESELEQLIERAGKGEPVQYIIGFEWFCQHKFKIGEGVLIPRPETEQLVQIVSGTIENGNKKRIIDLCCGSGCIAWSLWDANKDNPVFGCDVSHKALTYARSQRETFGTAENNNYPIFFKCDILSENALQTIQKEAKFDIIISNPPYIASSERETMRVNVKEYEPHEALFVPDENPLLFYKAIADIALKALKHNGLLWLECNSRFIEETAGMLREKGLRDIQILDDFISTPRFIKCSL